MKKIFSVFLGSFIFLTSVISVVAIEDNTPPTIEKINSNKNEVMGGETITYTLEGNDDLSGINTYMIEYRSKNNQQETFSVQFDNNGTSNTFSGSFTVPKTTTPGEWEFFVVQIWDVAGNLRTYFRDTPDDQSIINFSSIDLYVKDDPSVDRTYPVLNSASISPNELAVPGSFTVTVDANDNVTKNLHINVFMSGINTGTTATKVSNNKYTAKFDIEESDKYKNIEIDNIQLTDDSGNMITYVRDISNYGTGKDVKLLPKKYALKVKGIDKKDVTPPVLKNYKGGETTVYVPGFYKPILEVVDDISGFAEASVAISEVLDDGNRMLSYYVYVHAENKEGNTYFGELSFDEYNSEKTFVIEEIVLSDFAENKSTYSINSKDPSFKIEERFLKLAKGKKSDISTGTMNKDYVEDLKNSPADSIISIDATKNNIIKAEVFDSIRNTNKTIVINNRGIEWVFEGADIVGKSKDIDTKIEISTFTENGMKMNLDQYISGGNGIIVEFAQNGTLPGKALVKIKADYTLRNYVGETDLYVYYYNETDKGLEAVANKIDISPLGFYEFYIDHNSKYLISSKKANSVLKDSSNINEEINKEKVEPKEVINNKKEIIEEVAEENKVSKKNINRVDDSSTKTSYILPFTSFIILTMLVGLFYYSHKNNWVERIRDNFKKR